MKIIGTTHVSKKSVELVKESIKKEKPDIIAIELCENRFHALLDKFFREKEGGGSFPVLRTLKEIRKLDYSFIIFITGKILEIIQKEIGKKFRVLPGEEMVEAIKCAKMYGSRIALIDRKIEVTLNRLLTETSFSDKFKLLKFRDEGEILSIREENLLDEKFVEKLMEKFKNTSPKIYKILVDERDRIMANSLFELQEMNPNSKIVAVVGIGHKKGILNYLNLLNENKENKEWMNLHYKNLESYNKTRHITFFNLLNFFVFLILIFIFGLIFSVTKRNSVL